MLVTKADTVKLKVSIAQISVKSRASSTWYFPLTIGIIIMRKKAFPKDMETEK